MNTRYPVEIFFRRGKIDRAIRVYKLKKIILPGWAVPAELYAAVSENPAMVYDFGFFSGESSGLPHGFDSEIEKLCSVPCIIIAHSLGSILAFGLIHSLHNVKALVLYSAFAKFAKADDNLSGQPVEIIQGMKRQVRENPAGLLKSFYRNMFFPDKHECAVPQTLNIPALAAGLDILLDCDNRPGLNGIKIPVLLIHGGLDRIVNVKIAEELAGNIKFSRLHVFKNAGHAVHFTDADESKIITEKFLADYDIH